ncbi:MAG TPA: protein kinase [Kofleriaceae bacterium]|nr:protein kinase [Kofleriaceae bacterium]
MAPGAKVDAGVDIGHVFLGKYRVDAIIGHGGMGVVAECTHLQLGERVAIKMLRKDVLLDDDAVQRFTREAQAAAKLKSEYVAKVTDVGRFENNVPYMVMEFLEGHDLGQLLEQRGVLPVPWASELIMQTAEALAEAHSLGIVHRDVKPTNLFVTWRPDGSALIKVLDFGISKSPMGADMQLTQTQSLLGTPAYMSPEQMRSARHVDTRSDIWSLGTVFYELLEGRRPFEAESFSEMCVKVAVDPPSPMVNTPPALQPVILKCLAKSPDQRYATMADLGKDLVPFVQDTHQAQRLVERMARMLRRSQPSWDADASGTVRRSSSEPFGQALADRSSPALRRDPSEPVTPAPLTMMQHKPHSRGIAIVVGVGLLFGAGIALAVALGSGDDAKVKNTAVVAPTAKTEPLPAPPPVKVEAPAVPDKAVPDKAVPDKAVDQAPEIAAKPSHPITPAGVVTKKSPIVVKKQPPQIKDTPPPETKDATVKHEAPPAVVTPAAKCDPFGSMHGCDNGQPK